MKGYLYLLILVVGYVLVAGVTPMNALFAAVIAVAIIKAMPQFPGHEKLSLPGIASPARMGRIAANLAAFSWDFIVDLTMANLVIAWEVWTPRDRYRPRLVEVKVDDLSDFETAMLASRITLTPGTLSIDVTEDRQTLIVHAMYPGEDTEASLRRPIDLLRKGL